MAERNSNVQLLACLVDWDDEEDGNFRFLVDEKDVKYVTVAPGSLPKDNRHFAPVLIPSLPKFPTCEWSQGHVSKDEVTGELAFTNLSANALPGVKNNWHPIRIDHLELTKLDRLCSNIHKVSHPQFFGPVVVKFAPFPWQIQYIELETSAYERIDGTDIGPKFLGHVTEAGRTIGLLIELVEDAHFASPADLVACQRALARMHELGFKHGDINKYNFLVGEQGAIIIDFETMEECKTKQELEEEYNGLEESLADPSYDVGVRVTVGCRP